MGRRRGGGDGVRRSAVWESGGGGNRDVNRGNEDWWRGKHVPAAVGVQCESVQREVGPRERLTAKSSERRWLE